MKIIKEAKYYCRNNEFGCNEILLIDDLPKHEFLCKFKQRKEKLKGAETC